MARLKFARKSLARTAENQRIGSQLQLAAYSLFNTNKKLEQDQSSCCWSIFFVQSLLLIAKMIVHMYCIVFIKKSCLYLMNTYPSYPSKTRLYWLVMFFVALTEMPPRFQLRFKF